MLTFISLVSLAFFRLMMPVLSSILHSPTNSVSFSNFSRRLRQTSVYASYSLPRVTSFFVWLLTKSNSVHATSFCCRGMLSCAEQELTVELYTSEITLAIWLRVTRRGFEGGSTWELSFVCFLLRHRSWVSTSSIALLYTYPRRVKKSGRGKRP